MEEKKAHPLTRVALAEMLESLAGQLRQGSLEVKGRPQPVPDQVSAELEFKEKKGGLTASLKMRWSTLETLPPRERRQAEDRLAALKTVKKRLGGVFADLDRAVRQGTIPTVAQVAEFINVSKEFNQHTEPDWAPEMQVYLEHLENLALAVELQNLEMVRHELADLKNQMRACHGGNK